MGKSFRKQIRSLPASLGEVCRGERTPGELLGGLWTSARKAGKKPVPHEHKQAIAEVKRGINAYNMQDYTTAESCFNEAIRLDESYARAHYYLGNACYKQGHMAEAIQAWSAAVRHGGDSDVGQKAQSRIQGMHGSAKQFGDILGRSRDIG